MDNADLFLAAALVWFHGDFERVIQRIDVALHNTNLHRVIEWRTESVTDFRGYPVSASAERLVRWDAHHPNAIFNEGFIPRYAAQAGDPLADQHVDLNAYVNQNTESIFEVFAFGGIDINLSLGYHHRYWNQREVAFPGGIRPELIRTAREYDENGRVIRIWVNGRFDIEANGPNHRPRLAELPDPVCGSQVPVRYWFGPDQHQDHHRELRDVSNQEDVMREEGDPAADELMDGTDGTYPVKFLSEGDAPVEGKQYAINVFGTLMALTCVNSTALVLQNWQNKTTQHFRCTMYDGYVGFICAGAGGDSGRYLGFDSSETLVCKAHYQRGWEHIHPRADPAGGFMYFMHKDDRLAPVLQISPTKLKLMASSTIRFGITAIDTPMTPRVHWGLPAALPESRRPAAGGVYAIQIHRSTKAFTCVHGTALRLRDYDESTTQHFRCTLYNGFMGFICLGADNGNGRYLGLDGLMACCRAYYQRENEHVESRADPAGGFTLWSKKTTKLAPIAEKSTAVLEVEGTATHVVFKPIGDVRNM